MDDGEADHQEEPEAALQSLEQEVVAGDSGRTAILVGDGRADEIDASHDESTPPRSKGACPGWLRESPTALKAQIAATTVALLVFLAVTIAGVVRLGGTGGPAPVESSRSESATAGPGPAGDAPSGPAVGQAVPLEDVVLPSAPSPRPQSSPALTTDSPVDETRPSFVTTPVSEASITIGMPAYLEETVPDFEDGLSVEEEEDWLSLEQIMVDAITITLLQRLPKGFALDAESVQIEKFDGYIVSAIRERRRRQRQRLLQGSFGLHDVEYSFVVTANCDDWALCYVAPDVVEDIVIEISGLEEVRVSADTAAPLETMTEKPSSSPVVITDAPASASPTDRQATLSPTLRPVTLAPVTPSPTGIEPLRDQVGGCNVYAQCERCYGGCRDGSECEEGLSCFVRRGFEAVPGCEGPGVRAQAYCYDPLYGGLAEESLLAVRDVECDKKDRCDKCQGRCSQDEDCEKDLVCYRRFGLEVVPGCASQGVLAVSYCFDPDDYVAPVL